ncbi:mycofactocin biosynthesis glycosyltransferase MftF [Aeromicrobium ginsengisoli]|uniref:Mycofactocin system glycosyltransferase n=1 Tax=Aeromicrobium ginsengisoli TaxID=363867 RepID=A0A5M4FE41_9ACTN|nr:mycofactocin biosynthesis glycosyltransferase MftF [Aeromicrobium ginsengisoli]KAA1397605.1 mycofactocin system glycosyltransferase [Aeromicrobium ginsengisoli]
MTLPEGFAVRLAPRVRVRDGGRTLIGGAPIRVNHLSARARDLLRDGSLVVSDATSGRLAEQLIGSGMTEPVTALLDPIDLDKVTCVIPVRDRPAELDRLLVGLDKAMRVVVVDDASIDPERMAKVAGRHGADFLPLHRNVGPAGARNAGLREVRTPYVAFVDSDVVIEPAAVARLLKHLHDPQVALVAPRILALDHDGSWIGRYESARSSLDLGRHSALVRPQSTIAWVPSAVVVARVDALGEGFDASMAVGEDVDLVWRLDAEGWRIRYDADVVARHDHRTSLRRWLHRKAFYGSGAAALADRHGSKVAPAVLTPIGAATAVAALAQRRWSLPAMGLLSGVMTWRLSRSLRGSDHPVRTAGELAVLGISSNLAQLMHLLLRHWWPAAAVGAMFSPRLRRALVIAAVADTVIERRRLEPDLDPVRFAMALRLDDAAYGAGLWAGTGRRRRIRALLPDLRIGVRSP